MNESVGRPINTWKEDIRAAEELMYSSDVIEAVMKESDPIKRTKILAKARRETCAHDKIRR